jgi:DNA invertase Pin-like site-specific DNA recombinase
MKQAIIYLRVSTTGQVTDGVSLDAQESKARAWCELNDYEVKAVYTDAGISGKSTANREGLQNALDSVKKENALVVYSLSRLARSTKDTIQISETLNAKGVDLVSLSEKIDTTTAAGKMVFRMLAVLSEFERDQVSERTSAALQHKKAKGERTGSIPYGFKLAMDNVKLLKDKAEQALIALCKELKEQGLSLRKIAAKLAEQGFKNRVGSAFNAQTVKNILVANEV